MSGPNNTQPVKAIYGHEPMREGEYPASFIVGGKFATAGIVDRIAFREDNFGDHGIAWYDIYVGSERVATMSARAVAEVHYQQEPVA